MRRIPFRGFLSFAVGLIGMTGVPGVACPQRGGGTSDVTGRWELTIRTPDGPAPRTLDLVMAKDGGVTGTVGAPFGSVPITSGRFAHDSLHIDFAMAGGQIRVTLDGSVQGDSLRGAYRQDEWTGDVSGSRTPAPASPPRGAIRSHRPSDLNNGGREGYRRAVGAGIAAGPAQGRPNAELAVASRARMCSSSRAPSSPPNAAPRPASWRTDASSPRSAHRPIASGVRRPV